MKNYCLNIPDRDLYFLSILFHPYIPYPSFSCKILSQYHFYIWCMHVLLANASVHRISRKWLPGAEVIQSYCSELRIKIKKNNKENAEKYKEREKNKDIKRERKKDEFSGSPSPALQPSPLLGHFLPHLIFPSNTFLSLPFLSSWKQPFPNTHLSLSLFFLPFFIVLFLFPSFFPFCP